MKRIDSLFLLSFLLFMEVLQETKIFIAVNRIDIVVVPFTFAGAARAETKESPSFSGDAVHRLSKGTILALNERNENFGFLFFFSRLSLSLQARAFFEFSILIFHFRAVTMAFIVVVYVNGRDSYTPRLFQSQWTTIQTPCV